MKAVIGLALGCAVGLAACSSNPHSMSPRVERALGESIVRSAREVRGHTGWNSYGHGLTVEVRAPGDPATYARDLAAETDGAAAVCAALAASDLGTAWDFVEVQYHLEYGPMPPRSRDVVGVVEVLLPRETMRALRDEHAPASEFARRWTWIRGFKDQPDSGEMLRW